MSRSRGRLSSGWRLGRRIFRAASSSGVWRTLAAKGAADARASERNPNSDSADALRSDVLIGAPRANTSGEVLERGAVYSCPWAGGAAACRQVLFDSSGTPVRHHARRLPLSKLRMGKTLFLGGGGSNLAALFFQMCRQRLQRLERPISPPSVSPA